MNQRYQSYAKAQGQLRSCPKKSERSKAVRVRNKAVRDWSLSLLRQESRFWNFWRRRLRCKSLLGAARFCNVAKERKFPGLEFLLQVLMGKFLLCIALLY
ncbi:hypothetical protein HMPREF9104_02685 [Lentilactobacillus kisonensis F0435]|uniref:Uncharacterized protein n=1 Tax=Lentilactobacillus kisonensis F0435 TaxID=797516 RepID=H1LJ93_9LACO|nr:hypothetical protein HMPREF9104_02685 [Lentilactobacillus kisonensis F0435]